MRKLALRVLTRFASDCGCGELHFEDPAESKSAGVAIRVAARFQQAMEFDSPEALKKYLHDHPDADKSKHTVKKPEQGAPKGDQAPPEAKDDHKKDDHGHGEKPKTSWKDFAKGLSQKAKAFVQKAPEAVKSFVNDEQYRAKALMSAHEQISKAPGAFVRRVIEEGKHEAKEIKQAGEGIVAVLKGGKMSHEQKHALKAVATHVAIATAATALTGGLGIGAAALAKGTAGAFAQSLAKKIALKAITPSLGALPTIEELGHAGHGAAHIFQHFTQHLAAEGKKDPTPEEAFEAFIAAIVADGLKDLDAETLKAALEDADEG